MPRIRSLVSMETPEEMMKRVTDRLGLEKPWGAISRFLAKFLPGDRPGAEIAAIDCVPSAKNRLKIYFRTDILSYTHLEHLLTLGGALSPADVSAGLRNAKLAWDAITGVADKGSPTQSPYFPSGLVYYELRQGRDVPSSKVYLPVQRYLPNDLTIARGVECLAANVSGSTVSTTYSDFIQAILCVLTSCSNLILTPPIAHTEHYQLGRASTPMCVARLNRALAISHSITTPNHLPPNAVWIYVAQSVRRGPFFWLP